MTAKKVKLNERYLEYQIERLEEILEKNFKELESIRAVYKNDPKEIVHNLAISDVIRSIEHFTIMIRTIKAAVRWAKGSF